MVDSERTFNNGRKNEPKGRSMNPNTDTNGIAAGTAEAQKAYRPKLVFYHPNGKGTGCAVQFELRAATGEREGALFAAFANQKSVAGPGGGEGAKPAATFGWGEKITVKLNFQDICQLLPVLEGSAAAAGGGKGLFHDAGETSTVIHMSREAEPVAGVAFEVSKKRTNAGEAPQRSRILFTETEAAGLAKLFAAILLPMAFGR